MHSSFIASKADEMSLLMAKNYSFSNTNNKPGYAMRLFSTTRAVMLLLEYVAGIIWERENIMKRLS